MTITTMNEIKIIDAHTHVQFSDYDNDRPEVIKRALDNGIGMINAGADLESTQKGIDLANQFDWGVWATAGLHPTDTQIYTDINSDKLGSISENQSASWRVNQHESAMRELEKLAQDKKVVGIGECGFDAHFVRELSERKQNGASAIPTSRDGGFVDFKKEMDLQKDLFEKHILLSNKLKKPLVIHCREAFDETFLSLDQQIDLLLDNAGIFHFFTGGIKEAKKILELGFSVTFGGLITYNRNFDEVIKYIPLENILIETDAPFVPVKSHRKERNDPFYVTEVLDSIAEIKNIELEEARETVLSNTKKIFSL